MMRSKASSNSVLLSVNQMENNMEYNDNKWKYYIKYRLLWMERQILYTWKYAVTMQISGILSIAIINQ